MPSCYRQPPGLSHGVVLTFGQDGRAGKKLYPSSYNVQNVRAPANHNPGWGKVYLKKKKRKKKEFKLFTSMAAQAKS